MRTWVGLVCCWLAFASDAHAAPSTKLYVLAIGYNGVPGTAVQGPALHELRFADDDAAAFAQFAQDIGGQAIVLSSFDADTARRFPQIAAGVRPALRAELKRAIDELNAAFERDLRVGIEPTLLVTYSGHGAMGDAGPALTLADAILTQEALYSEVLAPLKARFVHLIVDACHAEAVVRPRDAQAEIVTLTADELSLHWSQATLRRLPQVGALVASSASALSHEWDLWQQGVFTHEVVSGLRGAADVNGDLKIEYSEMAAFLSAANREVSDAGARVRPVLAAPAAAPRVAIVELGKHKAGAFVTGRTSRFGGLWVETENGQRVADFRSERTHELALLVPSKRKLFVRTARGEALLILNEGERAALDSLALRQRATRPRGALDLSLQRGLFAAPFGPAYYRGFVDNADEAVVPVPLRIDWEEGHDSTEPSTNGTRIGAYTALGAAGALLIASGIFGIAALDAQSDFSDAHGLERRSAEAADRYQSNGTVALVTLISGLATGALSVALFAQE